MEGERVWKERKDERGRGRKEERKIKGGREQTRDEGREKEE